MVLPRCSSFLFVILLVFSCFSFICLADDANNDINFFHNLYDTIESTLIPSYDHGVASPTQVILFETPGLAINRDLFDATTWSTNNYAAQQPDAVVAQLVDRVPLYSSSLFVDSGVTISSLWGSMLYQFVVPITDDPIAAAKLMDARSALANGTLQNAFSAASLDYEQSYNDFVNFRTNCLAKQNTAGICSAQAVLYRERLLRKWFTLEVARRDLSSAEARIIAVQTTDLKSTFAQALYLYSSNERIDMGTAGIGQNFFQTFLSPSNFYLWFAPSGAIDYDVEVGKSVIVDLEGMATTAPTKGAFSNANATNAQYTPTASILTSGLDTYTYTNGAGASITRLIRIIARDVLGGANSFTPITASSVTPQTDIKSFASNFDTPLVVAGASSGIRMLGLSSTNAASSREALTGSGSVFTMSCEVTRVSITRPWLDTSILSLYPVAIRGTAAGSWSDGAITPAQSGAAYKFKLLPVSFIVARNIDLTFTLTSTVSSAQTLAENYASSVTVTYGVVFTGSAPSSFKSATRDYQETSKTTATGIHIRGPQVIGWICNPIPSFPTSDEAGVRNWEATQLARETAVTNVAAAATDSGLLPSADPPPDTTVVVGGTTP